ncbi:MULTISPECIES: sugar phosphate isomerase/epimerase family protein [unclassified Saccharicrinis]|uniref:sugar phosphate isomerase/epimerase family protein n=1 Tax=unclassified Saccharicrinis TaxID=2646859 RepID=UPI003D34AF29
MRYFILISFIWAVTFLPPYKLFAQKYTISTQKDRLHQYAGQWVSTIHPNTDSIASNPQLKMINTSNTNHHSLNVEVLRLIGEDYHPILHELIGFDRISQDIFAAGHNDIGDFFTGKGQFTSENRWMMQDADLNGKPTMKVIFNFQSFTDVIVEGLDTENNSLWKTRYIKQNPKNNHIGIQLVSVHDEMQKDAIGTLKQLGRMGYDFVETFVYNNGAFYGMQAQYFKSIVEQAGMQFKGSMTFYNLPDEKNWSEAMEWWSTCISDHKKAGVSYLSTSNNQIKSIKTKVVLQRYCDYYNAVGKLCKESGLLFVYHNHADEFKEIDGIKVYDYFLENTNPEFVHFQADLYWMHAGGADIEGYFTKYPDRFISWHMKDYKELGESGKIGFKTILKNADTSNLKYLVAEVEDYSFPPLYSAALAWEYIHFEMLQP